VRELVEALRRGIKSRLRCRPTSKFGILNSGSSLIHRKKSQCTSTFDGDELSGNQVAFIVEYAEGGSAIYLASVPEPSAFVLLMMGVVGLCRMFQTR